MAVIGTVNKVPARGPKFNVGQVVIWESTKRAFAFKIIGRLENMGEWYYQWDKRNSAAESMLRALTDEEKGNQ
jgi:hypothetical protein